MNGVRRTHLLVKIHNNYLTPKVWKMRYFLNTPLYERFINPNYYTLMIMMTWIGFNWARIRYMTLLHLTRDWAFVHWIHWIYFIHWIHSIHWIHGHVHKIRIAENLHHRFLDHHHKLFSHGRFSVLTSWILLSSCCSSCHSCCSIWCCFLLRFTWKMSSWCL